MGGGIALQIKKRFPSVFDEYKEYCEDNQKSRDIMGECQIVDSGEGKFIANLFGQHDIAYGKIQTEYEHLKNALEKLKKFARENNYSIGLPFQLGCGLAGGDWGIVREIIDEVFSDYPVTIYKLPQFQ